jgi:hypothetical protein
MTYDEAERLYEKMDGKIGFPCPGVDGGRAYLDGFFTAEDLEALAVLTRVALSPVRESVTP